MRQPESSKRQGDGMRDREGSDDLDQIVKPFYTISPIRRMILGVHLISLKQNDPRPIFKS